MELNRLYIPASSEISQLISKDKTKNIICTMKDLPVDFSGFRLYYGFFNCTPVGRASDGPDLKLFSWLGHKLPVCCLVHRGPTGVFRLFQIFRYLFGAQGSPGCLLDL